MFIIVSKTESASIFKSQTEFKLVCPADHCKVQHILQIKINIIDSLESERFYAANATGAFGVKGLQYV